MQICFAESVKMQKCWPQTRAVSQQHVQVALQWVLIEGTTQPGPTSTQLRGNVPQGVESLELVTIQLLLHIEPEGQLRCRVKSKKKQKTMTWGGGEEEEES